MFFIFAGIELLLAIVCMMQGNSDFAHKSVTLSMIFLNLYYSSYIFLRVREFEKLIKKISAERLDKIGEQQL